MKTNKIILGIDPGTQIMGYGVLEVLNNKFIPHTFGIIDLQKYEDQYDKLKRIFERVVQIIDQYKPDEIAIEAPFFGKNVQSMLKLGRAQGVAISAGLHKSLPIFEYSPRKIKQAVTGNGNASKEQVASFLKGFMKINIPVDSLDATDAMAVAICHQMQNNVISSKKSYSSWKEFVTKNKDRIV